MRTMMKNNAGLALIALTLALVSAAWQSAQAQDDPGSDPGMAPLEQYLMDRNAEVALARSAAPPSISDDATVLVLTPDGYETAVEGSNGFVCLVDRQWQAPFSLPDFWNPRIRGPVCMNPQAARSVLPNQYRRTALALAGRSKDEIMREVRAASEAGELTLPEPGSMSYMMSPDQYLEDANPHWAPHVMFYEPGTVTAAEWGANLPTSPVIVGPDELPDGTREPYLVFVVPVAHWSDGSPAPGQSH